jgi:SARP family transcriptional regulator, regulator of embCAB operon
MERTPVNAYAVRADGLMLPAPIGGHPALDFCNTLAGWNEPEPGDFLRSYDHLAVWAAAWGLIDDHTAAAVRAAAAAHPGGARGVLAAARELRASLYRVFTQPEAGPDLDLVADAARRAYEAADLELADDGRLRWRLTAAAGLRVPLHAIALSAGEQLTSGGAAAVRACPGGECGWLFLDRSGRRRWCTMAVCGNRAKVRRFAERHRERSGRRRVESLTAPGG